MELIELLFHTEKKKKGLKTCDMQQLSDLYIP